MANTINYTSTTESITVVFNGVTHVVREGSPNFNNLRKALQDKEWDKVPDYLTVTGSIAKWSNSRFTLTEDGTVTFDGESVPKDFEKRVIQMATNGEDPRPLLKFYERLRRNPSKRSVDQLWSFLNKYGIPLTKDGCFLAYKGVKNDFTDIYSGTISNKPGTTVKLPRNSVSDDPNEACHFGLHVGAKGYASSFSSGGTMVICKVDPEHVVCVPYDYQREKMRVCEYKVVGVDGQDLPDTVFEEDPQNDIAINDDTDDVAEVEEVSEVESAVNKPKATVIIRTRTKSKSFVGFNKLDSSELMKKPIDELRKYAAKGLDIVGASKIPGGKVALIKKIIKARG